MVFLLGEERLQWPRYIVSQISIVREPIVSLVHCSPSDTSIAKGLAAKCSVSSARW